MKKYLRITIMERRGIAGPLKPCTYIVNKKFSETWNIPYEMHTKESLRIVLEEKCRLYGIKLVNIE